MSYLESFLKAFKVVLASSLGSGSERPARTQLYWPNPQLEKLLKKFKCDFSSGGLPCRKTLHYNNLVILKTS
ncbi:MAG TPA: hypothetical protein VFN27_04980 [Xanthobacteraceae bacterium]|nr:hypothetical protein [Xanthobacteraceae bacterium]